MILRDHWTNHKLRKKQANQKRLHTSVRLCGIRTRYCALIRRRSIQVVTYDVTTRNYFLVIFYQFFGSVALQTDKDIESST